MVVVLGHIDHGKTSLLDKIRQTNVAVKESGGITQHIGAYEVEIAPKEDTGGKITFIDTPGHEAFSTMRSRGVRVADIALLVVAADDGVKPQTEESLTAIKEAGIPFVVVLNKIDKESADPERVKKELGDRGVYIEEWGGKVPLVPVSAKTGEGIEHLLELILLLADLENLQGASEANAEGVVIESHVEARRGNAATLLVRNGTLKQGDFVLAGSARAKARIIENFLGKPVAKVFPSSPARVVGFDAVPAVGLSFTAFTSQGELEAAALLLAVRPPKAAKEIKIEEGKRAIPLIIKADAAGSLEAVEYQLKKIEDGTFRLNILRAAAGDISEDDIKLAASGVNSLAVGFRVKLERGAAELAGRFGVAVGIFDIIYELADWLKKEIEERLPEERIVKVLGCGRVLKIFKQEGARQIVGGKVESGVVAEGKRFRLLRRQFPLGEGRIAELQVGKTRVKEIGEKSEFGALADIEHEIVPGDEIEVFEEEIKKKKLA